MKKRRPVHMFSWVRFKRLIQLRAVLPVLLASAGWFGAAFGEDTFVPPVAEPTTVQINSVRDRSPINDWPSISLEASKAQSLELIPTALRRADAPGVEISGSRVCLVGQECTADRFATVELEEHYPKSLQVTVSLTGIHPGEYTGRLLFRSTIEPDEKENQAGATEDKEEKADGKEEHGDKAEPIIGRSRSRSPCE